MSIAARIRAARKKAGITQTVLAERADISQATVCRLETTLRGHKIGDDVLTRVAKVLRVGLAHLKSGK